MVERTGWQLGNYRITRLLGQGGFAEVYLAEHIHLNTEVAVKILTARLSEAEREQFWREARLIARLRHPHIIRILDFGVDEEIPFLVMDYAPSGTMRHLYPKGTRLSPTMILPYVKQVAAALQYAHDQKLVHRDVKPENILLEARNNVWLSDFGVAVAAHNSYSLHTQSITGTVAYMAPEQLQGKPYPASDQYALAAVIYEWLTGTCPFNGTYIEIGIQHMLNAPPPLRDYVPHISPAVEAVIMKALAKERRQRYERMQDFALAFEQACSEQSSSHERVPEQQAALPAMRPVTVANPGGNVTSKDMTLVTYTDHNEGVKALAWSPDGRLIASGGFNDSVHVWQAMTGDIFLTYKGHVKSIKAVAWSPDGQLIASAGSGTVIHVWQARTGKTIATYTCHTTTPRSTPNIVRAISWSPDGRLLAAATGDGTIYVWQLETKRAITTYTAHGCAVNALSWSPDGQRVASGSSDGMIHIWQADSGNTLVVCKGHTRTIYTLSWSPDWQQLASGSGDGTVHIWQAATGRNMLIYKGHALCVYAVSWSPEGRYIASGGDDKTVQVWDTESGRCIYTYHGHASFVVAVAWSPDGRSIASAGDDKTIRVWQVATEASLAD